MREKRLLKNVAAFLLTLAMVMTCIPAMSVNAANSYLILDMESEQYINADIGDRVLLSVKVKTDYDPDMIEYRWFGSDIPGGTVSIKGDKGKTYTIDSFQSRGNYSCEVYVNNEFNGMVRFHVYHENHFAVLNDSGEPEEYPLLDRQCDFGGDIELRANLTGDEIEDGVIYRWYDDGYENIISEGTEPTLNLKSLKAPFACIMEATDKFGNVARARFCVYLDESISYRYPATVTIKSGNDVTLNITPFIDGKDLDTSNFTYSWNVYDESFDGYDFVDSVTGDGSFTFKNVTEDMKIKCEVSCTPEYRDFYINVKVGDFPEPPSTEEPSDNTTESKKDTTEVKKDTAPVVSTVKASGIRIDGISKKIAAGKKIKLQATVAPENATNKAVIWASSNPKVATVDRNGLVKVNKKAAGKSVIITATTADGAKASYKIKAVKGVVKKVTISGAKTVKAGKALKLKSKVLATKGANKKLAWTSSNENYAIVKNGKVKALKAGKGKKVKITAMATDGSGKKATVKVKIK